MGLFPIRAAEGDSRNIHQRSRKEKRWRLDPPSDGRYNRSLVANKSTARKLLSGLESALCRLSACSPPIASAARIRSGDCRARSPGGTDSPPHPRYNIETITLQCQGERKRRSTPLRTIRLS